MGKAAAELLFKGVEMAAHEGDGAEEIPDDAVTHNVGPVKAYRHRLGVAVDHHRHHVAGAQIDAQPQRCVAGGGRLVTQGRRFLQSWGEPELFVVRHESSLIQCETHPPARIDAAAQRYARWSPLRRLA
ncbi:Uncharacterised protein [Salmonella enterica subsp. enterica serovar Bovismorbificans]|nr:Uncharacterised protein [Salmonella enterica subsp. enterica serovar Bovismorbificans]